jgi:glucokinase
MREVVAAVDVGGTRVKAALVDRSYDVVAALTVPTPADVAADIGGTVAAAVAELLADAGPDAGPDDGLDNGSDAGLDNGSDARPVRVVGCGVVVPGLVDERRGVGLWSANLGWRDLPVADAVSAHLQVTTAVGHDVRAGLLAEARLGAARGARHALFLPVGTGIAGALLLEGVLISADGWAGELGHMVVDPAGPPCACGAVGCLEAIGSASAVERAYAASTGRRCSAEQVAALTAAGEPSASLVWERAVSALGAALAATVTLTGVDLVLLGGGLAESGETLLRPLRADLDARLTFQRRPRLEKAALGDRAGCLGAACLAWDAL